MDEEIKHHIDALQLAIKEKGKQIHILTERVKELEKLAPLVYEQYMYYTG